MLENQKCTSCIVRTQKLPCWIFSPVPLNAMPSSGILCLGYNAHWRREKLNVSLDQR